MVKLAPKPESIQQRPSLLTLTTLGRLTKANIKDNSLSSSVTFQVIIVILLKVI